MLKIDFSLSFRVDSTFLIFFLMSKMIQLVKNYGFDEICDFLSMIYNQDHERNLNPNFLKIF